jgi:hypothetical protein
MMRRTFFAALLAVLLLVCAAAWYLFRPEKAFIDNPVDEPFPGEASSSAARGPGPANPPGAPVSRSDGR